MRALVMASTQNPLVQMAHTESRLNVNCLDEKNPIGPSNSTLLSHLSHISLPYYKTTGLDSGHAQIDGSGCTVMSPPDFTTGCNDINTRRGHGFPSPRYQTGHIDQHSLKMDEYCDSPAKEEAPVVYPWMKRVHTNTGEVKLFKINFCVIK